MIEISGQLTLDAQPTPAVSVTCTYSPSSYFLDREGTPRKGGVVLALVSTPFGGRGHDEETALGDLVREVTQALDGHPPKAEPAARLLSAANDAGRLEQLLRAGIGEPILDPDEEPSRFFDHSNKSSRVRRIWTDSESLWVHGWPSPACQTPLDHLRVNLKPARAAFSRMRREGAPSCCALHHAWDFLMDWPSQATRHDQLRLDWTVDSHLPCGLFHAGTSPLPLRARLARIARHHWLYLRPGRTGRHFREQVMWSGPFGPQRVRRPIAKWNEQLGTPLL